LNQPTFPFFWLRFLMYIKKRFYIPYFWYFNAGKFVFYLFSPFMNVRNCPT
jgi:hypothetical protein